MNEIFGPEGLLARKLAAYEDRPEQGEMAGAVDQAFREENFLVVEAGTGTGKTLAYLIPAVLSGKKVVISTGTKALQEQLFHRDIPFLQKKLAFSFRAAFMKGRANYLCRRRYRLFSQQPLFKELQEITHFEVLKKWAARTRTGDRAELSDLPEELDLWKEVCATNDACLGQGCESFDRCFITAMRQEAAGADVIVVNHHLFFADLAVRMKGYGEVLPRYEALIFDEAHQMEEVATRYLGSAISNFRFEELARDIRRESTAAKMKDEVLNQVCSGLLDGQEQFFQIFQGGDSRYRLRPERLQGKREELAAKLMESLSLLSSHIEGMKDPAEGLRALARRSDELKGEIQQVMAFSIPDLVYWCELRGRGVFLHASPIDLASPLQAHLYSKVRIAVFTSATLSTQGHFRFFRDRVGLTAPEERVIKELKLSSSFNLADQALLYLPREMPDPNQANFVQRAAEEIEKILHRTRGRAFLLFTSIKNMEEAYRLLTKRLPFTSFLQGERPKSALLQAFKEDIHSVLFATSSFWEGIDVQGEALSCVIVDRLPFTPPNEPILEARLERIASAGGSPFWEYQVPSAIILLKQGLGRLIRTRQDRGVLAILDPRLRTKGYGKAFLESLPPCPLVRDPRAIEDFFGKES